jgi:hypothetical protein
LHHIASFLFDATIRDLPSLMDLESFSQRQGQVALEPFDELMLACDAEDGGEEVVEAGHLSTLLLWMRRGVVFLCGTR